MTRRSLLLLVAAFVSVALLGGCDAGQELDLSANPWSVTDVLTANGVTTVLDGTFPSVYFRPDGLAVGNASVNTFSAPFSVDDRTIEVGSVTVTEWEGPQMEQAQEDAVLAALEAASRYAIDDDTLTLSNASGDTVMRLTIAPEPELVGPLWRCTEILGEDGQLASVVGTNPAGSEFAPNGELGGTGGVSTYTTTYTVEGARMTVGPEFETTEASGSNEMQAQEARYYEALKRTASYKIEKYQLTLIDASGATLAVHIPWAPSQ